MILAALNLLTGVTFAAAGHRPALDRGTPLVKQGRPMGGGDLEPLDGCIGRSDDRPVGGTGARREAARSGRCAQGVGAQAGDIARSHRAGPGRAPDRAVEADRLPGMLQPGAADLSGAGILPVRCLSCDLSPAERWVNGAGAVHSGLGRMRWEETRRFNLRVCPGPKGRRPAGRQRSAGFSSVTCLPRHVTGGLAGGAAMRRRPTNFSGWFLQAGAITATPGGRVRRIAALPGFLRVAGPSRMR